MPTDAPKWNVRGDTVTNLGSDKKMPAPECAKCGKPKFGPHMTMASGAYLDGTAQALYCQCMEFFSGTTGPLPSYADGYRAGMEAADAYNEARSKADELLSKS